MVRGVPTALTCFFVGLGTKFVSSVWVSVASAGVLALAGLGGPKTTRGRTSSLPPPPPGYVLATVSTGLGHSEAPHWRKILTAPASQSARRPATGGLGCTRWSARAHSQQIIFLTDQFQDQFLRLCGAVWGGVVRGGGKCDRKGCCGSQCVYFNANLLAFRQHGMWQDLWKHNRYLY